MQLYDNENENNMQQTVVKKLEVNSFCRSEANLLQIGKCVVVAALL